MDDWRDVVRHQRGSASPAAAYTIEHAYAVTGPWSTLATPAATSSGLIEYLDASQPLGAAFYRTRKP